MRNVEGKRVILTAPATEMSEWAAGNALYPFLGGVSTGLLPLRVLRRIAYPPVKDNPDGSICAAPYGLRKVEAVLLNNGFDESDIAVVHPFNLDKFISPRTKVVGVSSMDPMGKGYASKTYSMLTGGGPSITTEEFRNLMVCKYLRTHSSRLIIGGAGAWQLMDDATRERFGIDCVIVGEAESIIADLFHKAIKEESLPGVLQLKSHRDFNNTPPIRHGAIHGCVEITRGCGRGCRFCTPTMQKRRDVPLQRITQETRTNVADGSQRITLVTEDLFMYGLESSHFDPNRSAVLNLLSCVSSIRGVRSIQPAHTALAPVLCDGKMVEEAAEILLEFSQFSHRGEAIITSATGIETGSDRLARKFMAGKFLPFKELKWRDLVIQALGVLNDNRWFPMSTLIIGMPEETERDIIDSLELLDDMRGLKTFLVPILFAPLHKCGLENQSEGRLDELHDLRARFLVRAWEFNMQTWGKSFLDRRFTNALIRALTEKLMIPFAQFLAGVFVGARLG